MNISDRLDSLEKEIIQLRKEIKDDLISCVTIRHDSYGISSLRTMYGETVHIDSHNTIKWDDYKYDKEVEIIPFTDANVLIFKRLIKHLVNIGYRVTVDGDEYANIVMVKD